MAIATGVQWMSRDERGSVLVSAMMLVLAMTLIGAGIFYAAVVDNRLALNNSDQVQTLFTAEAGLNVALRELADGDGTHDFTSVLSDQQYSGNLANRDCFPDPPRGAFFCLGEVYALGKRSAGG